MSFLFIHLLHLLIVSQYFSPEYVAFHHKCELTGAGVIDDLLDWRKTEAPFHQLFGLQAKSKSWSEVRTVGAECKVFKSYSTPGSGTRDQD